MTTQSGVESPALLPGGWECVAEAVDVADELALVLGFVFVEVYEEVGAGGCPVERCDGGANEVGRGAEGGSDGGGVSGAVRGEGAGEAGLRAFAEGAGVGLAAADDAPELCADGVGADGEAGCAGFGWEGGDEVVPHGHEGSEAADGVRLVGVHRRLSVPRMCVVARRYRATSTDWGGGQFSRGVGMRKQESRRMSGPSNAISRSTNVSTPGPLATRPTMPGAKPGSMWRSSRARSCLRLVTANPREIDDFMTVPRSRPGWGEARPVARTSRPSHPPPRCRQRRELLSRNGSRA